MGWSRGSLALGRVAGIAVRVHFSGIIALAFFIWFASRRMRLPVLAAMLGGNSSMGPWSWGLLLGGGLVIALLLHEGAHAVVARLLGGRVGSITLWLLGGCAVEERLRPRSRALVALAGPLVSIVVGASLVGAGRGLELPIDGRYALVLLGEAQLVLGFVHLLPAPPLDGGRLLQVGLEGWLGRSRSGTVAARAGRLLAVAIGIAGTLTASLPLIAIAAILWSGAATALDAERHDELENVSVDWLLTTAAPSSIATIGSEAPLREAVRRMKLEHATALVVIRDGQVAGVVEARDLRRIPEVDRADTRVGQLTRSVPAIDRDGSAEEALARLRASQAPLVLVVEGEQLVGLLGSHVLEQEALLLELGAPSPPLRLAERREAPSSGRRRGAATRQREGALGIRASLRESIAAAPRLHRRAVHGVAAHRRRRRDPRALVACHLGRRA